MIRDWQNFLVDHVSEWGVSGSGEWHFLLHNNYHPHCSNINVLWFEGKSKFPAVVTKLYREPEILRREFGNLKRAHGLAPAWVPRPLHFGQQGPFWSLWMQGLPGARYAVQTKHSPATLRSMIDMVAALHSEVAKTTAVPAPDRYARLVSTPLRAVVEFAESAKVKEGCAKLAAAVPAEWIAAMPAIPQHGDLFCDNLLHHQGQWHVIDWESFGTIDLPFYDALTLLLSLAGATEKGPEAWDATLVQQIPELVQRYANALGLQATAVRQMLPLTLVNWFYLQWCDGRQEFSQRMYGTLDRYFSSPHAWEKAFLGK
jgi:aminoglycoside phosphotransferase (APT) family kinase protein